jgi:hypothetical protein
VFIAAGTSLQNRYLAIIGDTYTGIWEGFIKCATEMGPDAMIYMPSFIKIGLDIQ